MPRLMLNQSKSSNHPDCSFEYCRAVSSELFFHLLKSQRLSAITLSFYDTSWYKLIPQSHLALHNLPSNISFPALQRTDPLRFAGKVTTVGTHLAKGRCRTGPATLPIKLLWSVAQKKMGNIGITNLLLNSFDTVWYSCFGDYSKNSDHFLKHSAPQHSAIFRPGLSAAPSSPASATSTAPAAPMHPVALEVLSQRRPLWQICNDCQNQTISRL